jgi:hypothetical protein
VRASRWATVRDRGVDIEFEPQDNLGAREGFQALGGAAFTINTRDPEDIATAVYRALELATDAPKGRQRRA